MSLSTDDQAPGVKVLHYFVCTSIYHNANTDPTVGAVTREHNEKSYPVVDTTFTFSCMRRRCEAHFRFVVQGVHSQPQHIAYMLEQGEHDANKRFPCPAPDHGAKDKPKTLAEVFGEELKVKFVDPKGKPTSPMEWGKA